MCFSPEASFIASAFLSAVSVATYRSVKSSGGQQQSKLALVMVPVGFAIQQFSEGLVWLSLLYNFGTVLRSLSVYVFIFFAFIFWPAYIPLCIYQLEPSATRRKWLKLLAIVGWVVAAILLVRVLYFGITAQIASCHILYSSDLSQLNFTFLVTIMGAYLLATVVPLLIATFPGVRTIGVLIGLAYLATYLFYLKFLISVWCFFAAAISLLLYHVVLQKVD